MVVLAAGSAGRTAAVEPLHHESCVAKQCRVHLVGTPTMHGAGRARASVSRATQRCGACVQNFSPTAAWACKACSHELACQQGTL